MSNATAISPTRHPRYRREKAEVACVLTQRDLDILRLSESFRLLTSEHIQLLVPGSDQNILRRLQVLFHAGYLDRVRPRYVKGGGSAKMIYALANKGAYVLQKEGLIEKRSKTDRSAGNRELHGPFVRHRLMVSHIRALLTAACSTRPDLQFLSWREGREIQDTVEVLLPNKYADVPVAADGFFSLREAKGRMHLFLEADTGSMQIQRFTLKLKAYAAYWRAKKHTNKFGIRFFRVLTVTTSATRKQNLVSAAAAEDDVRALGRMFLFADESALSLSSPERVLGSIWTTAAGEDASLILGSDAESRNNNNLKTEVTKK